MQEALRTRPDQTQTWSNYNSTPITFGDAVDRVLAARGDAADYQDEGVNGLNTWAFGTADGSTMAVQKLPLPGRPNATPLALRQSAFAHLCEDISAPASYIAKLPAKLQIANVNYGLARYKGDAVFRKHGDEVRSIVSMKYAAIDDPFYLQTVGEALDAMGYTDRVQVRALATGPRMLMRLTVPSEALEVKSGDVIEYGVDFMNSEIKHSGVNVCPVTWREVCTNGMRAWVSEAVHKMRHVGDPQRLRDQLADAIPVAFAEARGDLEKWKGATELMVDDALAEIDGLRGFGMTKKESRDIGRMLLPEATGKNIDEMLKDHPTTAFDVANAITATARDRGNIDARLDLEQVGHRYLARVAA